MARQAVRQVKSPTLSPHLLEGESERQGGCMVDQKDPRVGNEGVELGGESFSLQTLTRRTPHQLNRGTPVLRLPPR